MSGDEVFFYQTYESSKTKEVRTKKIRAIRDGSKITFPDSMGWTGVFSEERAREGLGLRDTPEESKAAYVSSTRDSTISAMDMAIENLERVRASLALFRDRLIRAIDHEKGDSDDGGK